MKTIWKFSFDLDDDPQSHIMPCKAQLLHVATQEASVCPWVLCDPEAERESRYFILHGTGHPVNEDEHYVGTAHMEPFVWHLFEVKAEKLKPVPVVKEKTEVGAA